MIRWACGLLFRDFCTVLMRETLSPVEFRLLQVLKRCSQRMRASSLWALYELIYLLIFSRYTQENYFAVSTGIFPHMAIFGS